MKKTYIVLILFLAIFYGCSEKTSLVEPDLSSPVSENSFNFLNLPARQGNSLYKIHKASKEIINSEGGTISINDEYSAADGEIVKVFASIEFPAGAFFGDSDLSYNIEMTLDDETTSESFSPHMYFNKYPVYNVRYEGLDLSNVNTDEIKFMFRGDDGSVEELEYDPIRIDTSAGTLEVQNVKLPHFSRYGFGN